MITRGEFVQNAIPGWIVKIIVTTIIGAFITGGAAWGVNLSRSRSVHETRITVLENDQRQMEASLSEIKTDIKSLQKQQTEDTKEILKRLPPRRNP